MIWFKHDSNAATDAKIKKLLIKYGAEGYAIYFHCLELIVSDISESNITFELEHDSEIIADDLRIRGTAEQSGQDRVNEIMRYMISLGLFEENRGKIYCYKILKRLDSSMTSNIKMRKMIIEGKKSHDRVMISHDDVMQEEKRLDRKEEKDKKEEKDTKPKKVKKETPTAELAVQKESELYKSIWNTFLSENNEQFTDYGKEGKAVKGLIKKAEQRFPEDPAGFIKSAIETYYNLINGNDKFWNKHPFIPSSLNSSGIWDRVLVEMKEQEVEDEPISFEIQEDMIF